MLKVYSSNTYFEERKYIYDVIFREFLGISYNIIWHSRADILIECNKKYIEIKDVFFQQNENEYLTRDSLPVQPLAVWNVKRTELNSLLTENKLPIIYGSCLQNNQYISCNCDKIILGIDIFGSAFFMLTRYEEFVKQERDTYDRFSAKDSIAYQEGFLERPIINEYIELLWWGIRKMFPDVERIKREFRLIPTHDVDRPFGLAFLSPFQIIHTLAGDLLKRKSLKTFFRRLKVAYNIKKKGYCADEDYTFKLIMDISDKHNLKSCFYFMTAKDLSDFDGNYDLEHPEVINLIREIYIRGHELGIHPSFISYKNKNQIKQEADYLRFFFKKIDVYLNSFGGRQHYLRWNCPNTWQYYEDAGIDYDTTLSYADHIGFRCGICYEYSTFNLEERKCLKLKERPLIVMECTALDKNYMNLNDSEVLSKVIRLKNICKKYSGDFVLLWHNSRLIEKNEIELYKKIIEG